MKLLLQNVIFTTKLVHTNLITKTDFSTKLISFNKIIISYKTKHLLAKNELKNCKYLIQFVLEAETISKKLLHKNI